MNVLVASLLLIVPQCNSFSPKLAVVRSKSKLAPFRATVEAEERLVSARQSGLALLLDDGTRKSHSFAENTAFVTGFFRGIETRSNFAKLVASLYFIYSPQENAFGELSNTKAGEAVVALDFPSLRRVPALEEDMEYYFGSDWLEKNAVRPSPATEKYVSRINELAGDPEQAYLLVAHQYTRYLGDLFGGQMMGGMASRTLGLDAGKGIAFYSFPQIPDTKVFIEDWYQKLNSLPFDGAEKEALVDEANLVFALNIELFEELEGNPLSSALRIAFGGLKQKLGLS